MAEFRKLPTQAELQNMLFMEQMRVKTPQQIAQEALASGTTVTPIPENVFQKIAGGAGIAKEYVNRAGSAADLAKLFPGYKPETRVNIPTGYNFAPKQAPTGEIIPGGLQTQNVNLGQVLGAIKPADVLGISGAERAYSDIGAGKAPQPLDVLDVAGLGATGLVGGKAALRATRSVPVGMSIQEAKGLLTEAPRSPLGFYSALEESALNLQRNKGSGQAFLNDLQKAPNVKADEIKWTGLDEFLKTKPNVTKQEVQDYLANNRVDVQEVRSTVPRLPGEEMPGDKGAFLPKFGQYTLPGGENYREILLTMPNTKAARLDARRAEIEAKGFNATEAERNEWASIMNQLQPETRDIEGVSKFRGFPDYKSPHFDQRNILAHLRVNDRVDADGKKMLLIEEVQSDWHQAGREKGYGREPSTFMLVNPETSGAVGNFATREEAAEFMKTSPRADEFAQRGFFIFENKGKVSVPDAPFKDSWYQLALKRAIQYAAENGYDRIGLTTGSQQAARFDLSKQVDELNYKKNPDGTYQLSAQAGGRGNMLGEAIPESKLSDYVGKEVAQKIIDNVGSEVNFGGSGSVSQPKDIWKGLSGIDLKIGGEGMKKYYDEIYPKFLDKYGKKWGARVGETTINLQRDLEGFMPRKDMQIEPVRYLDVTPEMKASVSKGQPLFQALPAIPATGLLATQDENR